MNKLTTVLVDTLVLIAANAAVYVVNMLGTLVLQSVFSADISADGIPTTTASTAAFLLMLFVAGASAAFIAAAFSRSNPWILVGILTLIAFIADFLAVQGPLNILPDWAEILVIVTIPPQMWIGAKLGIRLREKMEPESY